MAVYGGFAGNETALGQRDWVTNKTILSGDIAGDDTNTDGNAIAETWNDIVGTNSFHVVTAIGVDSSAVLDGFIITAGKADGSSNSNYHIGAGLYVDNSSLTLRNLIVSGNMADSGGGGLYLNFGNPTIINVVISGNQANAGAGLYTDNSSPSVINVTVFGNQATNGGGGGLFLSNSSPALRNTIVWGNNSSQFEAGIRNVGSSGLAIYDSNIQGGCPNNTGCVNVINADPQFVDAAGGDLHLRLGSPAMDTGNNAWVPADLITDLGGHPRINDGDGNAILTVDMGAYETRVRYAAPSAQGSGNCRNWVNACTLTQALSVANSSEQIWVKAGVHKPGSNRSDSFQLKSGVAVYGGFAGNETTLGQRDWQAHPTILSGDIDNNDDSNNADGNAIAETWNDIVGTNSFHVVRADNVDSSAVLDGFIITAGKADGSNADGTGGGIRAFSSTPVLRNLVISGNLAQFGGGLYADTNSGLTLANAVVRGNRATSAGGGIGNTTSNPTLLNVTLWGNSASSGGGIHNYQSSPVVVNAIVWDNTASNGAGIANQNGSNPSISYSNVQGCFTGSTWNGSCGQNTANSNIQSDPLFVDAAGGNLRLQPGSPAIDAGDNGVTLFIAADLDGRPRQADGNRDGTARVDMGAYESVPIRHAVVGGQTSGVCGSWSAACTLTQALSIAVPGDQIWVKAGVHTPTTNATDRSASFALKSGVAVYGGFAGTETALSQRDWRNRRTILSGDLAGDDTTDNGVVTSTANIRNINSYHVVSATDVIAAVLDGFYITAGKADDSTAPNNRGGGLHLINSRVTLRNLVISGNQAGDGGGMFNGTDPYQSLVTLINVAFSGNSATLGGAMYNGGSSLMLTNVIFNSNRATGGNNAGGGGMYNVAGQIDLINVTFSRNVGVAIVNSGNALVNLALRNTILWSNDFGLGIRIYANVIAAHSIIQGGCPSGATCTDVIDADPLFVDADGPDNIPGTLDDNLRLKGRSPAIDAGNNSFVPAGVTTDLDGKPRIQDGNGDNVAVVDMGAYEAPANRRPIANAGPDQSVSVGQLVTLNGSGSSDPDNNLPLSYAWTQTGGPSVTLSNPNTATPSFTPAQTGVYTFSLVVTDSLGLASAPDSVTITVTDVTNQPLLRLYLPLVTRQP